MDNVIFPKVDVTGERSIRFAFGSEVGEETFNRVQRFYKMAEKESELFIQEVVPGYHTVTVYLKKNLVDMQPLIASLLKKWKQQVMVETSRKTRKLRIPVYYGGEFGMDMKRVMSHTGLSEGEIITLHSNTVYTVYMIGFLPGFPYLGGLNEKLTTPRLETPRLKVPKGAVGIGGSQTGIYPLESPGGWNLIGITPFDIYDPNREDAFFIHAGDYLQFYPISKEQYLEMKQVEGSSASTLL